MKARKQIQCQFHWELEDQFCKQLVAQLYADLRDGIDIPLVWCFEIELQEQIEETYETT